MSEPRSVFSGAALAVRGDTDASQEYALKRCLDVALACVGLALSAPIWCLLAVVIKLDGGPVFYPQERWGKRGTKFRARILVELGVRSDKGFGASYALLTLPEMLFWDWLLPRIFQGARALIRLNLGGIWMLLSISSSICVAYALVSANMGTTYRHRAQVLPLLLVLAAVGLARMSPTQQTPDA